jgi:hypothetical protein
MVLAVAGSLAGASAGGAWAQGAPAAQPDPVRLELAHKLVEASGGQAQAELQMKMMFEAMKSSVAKNMPAEQAQLLGPIYDDLGQQMVKLTPQLLNLSARAYAQNYTEKELRDVLAFQTSESGQSMIHKAPQVRAQVMTEAMPLILTLMPEISRQTAARVCEQTHCTAKQRALVEAALARATGRPGA